MIVFKYTKCDGAEYLSHLDLLRHIIRTLKRAGIKVNLSGGFHKHPRIYLNNPLGLGIKSVAEYGAIDCEFTPNFKELFNANSPNGVKCVAAVEADTNPNFANAITSCKYIFSGIYLVEPTLILKNEHIPLTDLRGRETDIRPKIISLEKKDGNLIAVLKSGNENLRPDLFADYLEKTFGCTTHGILKVEAYGEHDFLKVKDNSEKVIVKVKIRTKR